MAYRILFAEDDPRIREIVTDYFSAKTEESLILVCAQDGTEAHERIHAESFDLLILDVMMPGIDGFSLCREIRAESDVPLLFLTARAREEDLLYGYAIGCDDYIIKPFSLATLYAKVIALLLAFLTAKIKYQTYSKQYALNAYRRKLTSALAHDLKTPLAAISGYAENLLESTHAEKHAHYANEIMQTTAHMDHIIADVLALAKLEDAQTVKTEPMDLNAAAKDTFARMQDEMDARAITVQFSGTYKCEANPA